MTRMFFIGFITGASTMLAVLVWVTLMLAHDAKHGHF